MRWNDAVLGAIFVIIALVVALDARGFPDLPGQAYGSGTLPTLVAAVMFCLGAAQIVTGVRSRAPAIRLDAWMRAPGAAWRMAAVPLFVAAFVLLLRPLGFPLVTPPLLFVLLLVMTVRPATALVVAVAATAGIWFVFARLLGVPLPLGLLTEIVY
jgi:putative tricarboxylic transport membrane protein